MKSNQPPKEDTSETAFPRGQENIVWAASTLDMLFDDRDLERTAVKQTKQPTTPGMYVEKRA